MVINKFKVHTIKVPLKYRLAVQTYCNKLVTHRYLTEFHGRPLSRWKNSWRAMECLENFQTKMVKLMLNSVLPCYQIFLYWRHNFNCLGQFFACKCTLNNDFAGSALFHGFHIDILFLLADHVDLVCCYSKVFCQFF